MIIELHACFLLVAGTTSAILRTGLVELPRQVEDERSTGGIVGGEVATAEDDGLGLVGVEEVDAAQVGSQRAEAAERDVFLDAEVANDAGAGDAEVVVLSLRGPLHVSTQTKGVGQFDGVAPGTVEPGPGEGDDLARGCGRFVVLEHGYDCPCGMPFQVES